jgi:hypothetical protein
MAAGPYRFSLFPFEEKIEQSDLSKQRYYNTIPMNGKDSIDILGSLRAFFFLGILPFIKTKTLLSTLLWVGPSPEGY